ncbi:MAG: hypothetical protein ACE369_04945 [Roseovarius sp.]
MTRPAHDIPTGSALTTWREILQSQPETIAQDGFALEHLIDLQRDRDAASKVGNAG